MKIEIGSPQWLQFRRSKIMASDAPIIMKVSPWCTPLQLYHKKKKGIEQPPNPAMQRGIELEPIARQMFEESTGHFVWPECRLHRELAWLGATFDGINDDGIAIEIKCPNKKDHEQALKLQVPNKYHPQLQHQMFVAEITQMYYVSYSPNHEIPFIHFIVFRDPVYCYRMLEKESAFHLCLENDIEPSDEKIEI